MKKWNFLWMLFLFVLLQPNHALGAVDPGTLEHQVTAGSQDGLREQRTVSVPSVQASSIRVLEPMQAGVYAPGPVPVAAEVYGEGAESAPLTVNLLEGDQLLAKLGEGQGAVSLSLDASSYAGKALTLQFISDNGQGQVLEKNRPLYIEDNPRLIPVETADGEIVDADEQRLLWVDEQGRLMLKQRGTSGAAVVYDEPGLPTSDHHLMDGGVLFLAQHPSEPESHLLYSWRDGKLTNLNEQSSTSNARIWNVAGDWAAVTFDHRENDPAYTSSITYNFKTDKFTFVPQSNIDSLVVGIDGTMAYTTKTESTHGSLPVTIRAAFIKEAGAEERKLEDSTHWRYGPPYFDGETLYIESYGILEKDPVSGQYTLVNPTCMCSKRPESLVQNNFKVYSNRSNWNSSTPAGSLILENKSTQTRQTISYPYTIERHEILTDDGEMAFKAYGRTYLKARSHNLPLSVSSRHGRMRLIGGAWHKTLGNTIYKVDIDKDTTAAPEWPEGAALTVTDIQGTSAKLQWQPVPGAVEYIIYTNTYDSIDSYVQSLERGRVSGIASGYTLSGLTSMTLHDAVIIAVDRLGQRSTPLWIDFRTKEKPAEMTMDWNADTLKAGSVLEWKIRGKVQDLGFLNLKLRYNAQLLKLKEVKVHSDIGSKGYQVSSSTPAPGELEVTGNKTWGRAPDKLVGFVVVKFEVLREGKADFTISRGSSWTGSGIRYPLYADLTQSLGSANPPVDSAPPVWPSAQTLTVTDVTYHSAQLQWQPAADNVGVAEYQLLRGDGSLAAAVTGGVYSHLVEGLDPSTSYTFRIEALDAAGNRSVSNPSVTLTTMDAPVEDTNGPLWPQGAALTVSDVTYHRVQLSWPAAQDASGISAYRIYSSGQLLETVNGSVYGYSVDGLQPDTEYAFSITAVDAAGNVSTDGNPQITVRTLPQITVPAAAQLSLTAKSGFLDVGSTFELNVAAEDEEDLYAFLLKLQYDPARFKLTNAVLGGSFGTEGRDAVLAKNFHTAGELKFSGSLLGEVPGRTGDTRLLTLKFTVLQKGSGEFLLAPDSQIADSEGVTRKLEAPVRLTVYAGGADLDGDGRVGLGDLILITKHRGTSAGQPGFEPRFDLNRDGRVDAVDVQIIANKVNVEV